MSATNAVDDIINAMIATLQAAAALSDTIVEDDDTAIGEDASDAIVITYVRSVPADPLVYLGQPIDWDTEISIECYARADNTTSNGRASRQLHAAAYARLMAEPSLGGRLQDLVCIGITHDQERRASRLGCCIGQYRTRHRTQSATLDAA